MASIGDMILGGLAGGQNVRAARDLALRERQVAVMEQNAALNRQLAVRGMRMDVENMAYKRSRDVPLGMLREQMQLEMQALRDAARDMEKKRIEQEQFDAELGAGWKARLIKSQLPELFPPEAVEGESAEAAAAPEASWVRDVLFRDVLFRDLPGLTQAAVTATPEIAGAAAGRALVEAMAPAFSDDPMERMLRGQALPRLAGKPKDFRQAANEYLDPKARAIYDYFADLTRDFYSGRLGE